MKSEIFILFFAFISPIKAFFPSTKAIVPAGSQYKRGSRCHLHLRILSSQVQNVAPTAKSIFPETLFMQYSKKAQNSLMASPLISFLTSYWLIVPSLLRHILKAMHPADFIFLGLFNLLYKKTLRLAHASQTWAFKVMKRSPPLEYDKSILGFVEKRSHLFVQLLAFNYIIKLSCSLLIELGLRIRPDFASILSRLRYP
jgi:hypothetical protein